MAGSGTDSDGAKAAQIERLIRQFLADPSAQEAEVIAAHPDLMPELAQQLKICRMVRQAQGRAQRDSLTGLGYVDRPHIKLPGDSDHRRSDTPADDTVTRVVPTESSDECPVSGGSVRDPDHSARTGEQPSHIVCPHCSQTVRPTDDADGSDVQCEHCGGIFTLRADDDSSRFRPGDRIDRFELLEFVGSGGFGIVWRARDPHLDRVVALKMPRSHHLTSAETERFLREARHAARIQHPNIVRIHEVGTDGQIAFIVSDFIEGHPLSERLRERPLTVQKSVSIAKIIALALEHIHQSDIVHRDLKSSNILLGDRGEPFLVDFGLAVNRQVDVTLTMEGNIVGTPAYMAPEQASGDSHSATARSDIYSLGVVLFEMLTGELPFRGRPHALFHQIVHDMPPNPRRLNSLVPRDLATICLKCMEKSPDRRFLMAGELAVELERFLNGQPIRSRPVNRIERAWRWGRRRPFAAALACVVALIALVAPILAGVFAKIANDARQSQQATAQSEEEKRELLYSYQMRAVQQAMEEPAVPDIRRASHLLQQQIPEPGQTDLRDFEWHYWQQQLDLGLLWQRQLTRAWSVDVSTDGRWLAVGDTGRGQLREGTCAYVENLQSGETFRLTPKLELPDQRSAVYAVAISPDSKVLAVGTGDSPELTQVEIFDLATQTRIVELPTSGNWVMDLAFSPDGAQLAAATYDGMVEFWTDLAPASHDATQVTDEMVRVIAWSPDGTKIAASGGLYRGERTDLSILDTGSRAVIQSKTVSGEKAPFGLAWSWDGKFIFSPSRERFVVRRLDAPSLERVDKPFSLRHASSVGPVCWSRDGRHFIAAGLDGSLVFWDAKSQQESNVSSGHAATILDMTIHPKDDRLFTASEDGVVKCWDLAQQDESRQLLAWDLGGSEYNVLHLAFSPDSRRLFAVSRDRKTEECILSAWDLAEERDTWRKKLPDAMVLELISSETNELLTAGAGGSVRRWDADTGEQKIELPVFPSGVRNIGAIAVSRDGSFLFVGESGSDQAGSYFAATGELTRELAVVDLDTNTVITRWKAHDRTVSFLTPSADESELFTVGNDKVIRRWDRNGSLLAEQEIGTKTPSGMLVVRETLVVIDHDGTIWRWSLQDFQPRASLARRLGKFLGASVSPSGRTVAVAIVGDGILPDAPGQVRLLDTNTWESKMSLTPEYAPVVCCFSPDGRTLAVGTRDGRVYLWKYAGVEGEASRRR